MMLPAILSKKNNHNYQATGLYTDYVISPILSKKNNHNYQATDLYTNYVISPSYVPYEESVNAAVFITVNKERATYVLKCLNSFNNGVTKHIHNMAEDIVGHSVSNPQFRMLMFGPNTIRARTSNPIKRDFLLIEGLINQTLDKVASSQRNQTIFDSVTLSEMRTCVDDPYFV